MAKATFGAGCFWGPEKTFGTIPGVLATEVGYAGGRTENPTYEQVCSGETGHAEVVRLEYDPEVVAYEDLLRVFFEIHDPTQVDRQGPDVGRQYRSVIYTHDEAQAEAARAAKQALEASGKLRRPIATAIEPAGPFWRAEDYHQKYLLKRSRRHGGLFG